MERFWPITRREGKFPEGILEKVSLLIAANRMTPTQGPESYCCTADADSRPTGPGAV